MKRRLAILALALLGLLCAAGVGFAAYLVSRDSVAVPVTRLQPTPRDLAPPQTRRKKPPPRTVPAPPPAPSPTETGDDHGGRGRGGGSGHGGGGGGDD